MWKYEGRYIGYQDGTSVTQFWFIQDRVLTPNLFPMDGRLVGAGLGNPNKELFLIDNLEGWPLLHYHKGPGKF